MFSSPRPDSSSEEVLAACASKMQDRELSIRVLAARRDSTLNSLSYRTYAERDELWGVSDSSFVPLGLTDAQLRWLYDQQLAKEGRPANEIYAQIKAVAPDKLCVYCNLHAADTLDHFLPKSKIAVLSVEPLNLVPACMRCNHRLNAHSASDETSQLFHPYFVDDLGRWLFADLVVSVSGLPSIVNFVSNPPAGLDPVTSKRIEYQFNLLRLANHYRVVSSASTVIAAATSAKFAYQFGREQAVQDHLMEMAHQYFAKNSNHWKAVVYEALANDQAFCGGGFNNSLAP